MANTLTGGLNLLSSRRFSLRLVWPGVGYSTVPAQDHLFTHYANLCVAILYCLPWQREEIQSPGENQN